ncbi:TerB family tellurite resistance protein [Planctobacterium marinum]|uniref:Co-chaperone DjlA N-terminal domain-containing protein n=1 Tax=Planctobacterium marinum TaxID=1631968 RepID=A0AA48HXY9_9ALTE|nr:hypothetical protein MACH26_34540 [Planctobacterium marinum]
MRFDKFLRTLDMGDCEDQIQREALLEIAIFFMVVDGTVDAAEEEVIRNWLAEIEWNSDISVQDFYTNGMHKANNAIEQQDLEHFIAHRSSQLLDDDFKTNALKLADEIASADGIIDDKEKVALDILKSYLN